MTKYLKLIFALSILSLVSYSQDCSKCKIQYEPSTNYSATMTTTSTTILKYEGTEEIIEKLIKKGYTNPSTIESEQVVSATTKTNKYKDSENFPITFEILTSKSIQKRNGEIVDKQESQPKNIKLYGNCSKEGKTKIDSVSGENMDEALKNSFIQIFSSIDNIVSFPEKCLRVGDTFTQDSPIDIPISGFEPIKMKIISKYTLTKKEGKLAYFQVEQKYTLTNSYEKIQISASGTGEGSMTVDTDKNYLTSNISKTELIFKIKAGDLIINMTQIGNTLQTINLTDN